MGCTLPVMSGEGGRDLGVGQDHFGERQGQGVSGRMAQVFPVHARPSEKSAPHRDLAHTMIFCCAMMVSGYFGMVTAHMALRTF